jgi:hypothetical protein
MRKKVVQLTIRILVTIPGVFYIWGWLKQIWKG